MKKDVKLFDMTKLRFATEIEVEFPRSKDSQKLIDRHRVLSGWEIDYDGSLDNGAEYRPTNKNHLYWNEESLTQLKEMLALIRVHRAKVNKNCGLHIHVDCKKFTDKQVLEIIKEFIHCQRYIVKTFGVHIDRVAQTCKLLPRENLNKLTVKQINKFRKGTGDWNFQTYSYLDEKYYSLNASHLKSGDYGTLEFRLYDSTLSYRKLKEQIWFTLSFIKRCIERE
jgi:hypothetical protein